MAHDSSEPVILMYHGVVDRVRDPDLDAWSITAVELRRHLDALTRSRDVVPLDTVVDALANGRALPARAVVLTFDDAYRGLFEHGWPLLREFGVPWTVFVPGGLVDRGRTEPGIWSALCALRSARSEIAVEWNGATVRHPLGDREERLALRVTAARTPGMAEAVVRAFGEEAGALLSEYPSLQMMEWKALDELAAHGVSIGAHGWLHRRLDDSAAPDVLAEEIERPREELARRRYGCRYFCAPYGVYGAATVDRVRRAGYAALVTSDVGRVTATADRFALPRLRADLPWSDLERSLAAPAGRRPHARRRTGLDGVRVPAEYHVADFVSGDVDDLTRLFKTAFRRDVPDERVRRGLGYRYVDNPYTGSPGTAPIVVRSGGPSGPMVGFVGRLPTPVRFRGRALVTSFIMDVFVHPDFQARRLGLLLLRLLWTRTPDAIFTSSAGPAMQKLTRYFDRIPIASFQRGWRLPVEPRPPSAGGRMRARLGKWIGVGTRGDLVPLLSISDEMVTQAARATAGATFHVERTRAYLDWRFGPPIRAAAPECALLGAVVGSRSVGWIVVRRREATLEVLDWLVTPDRHSDVLGLVVDRARALGCGSVTGRGMQATLHAAALSLGAAPTTEIGLSWTWSPDLSAFDGVEWEQAYLSATDGDLTLPWNLDPR